MHLIHQSVRRLLLAAGALAVFAAFAPVAVAQGTPPIQCGERDEIVRYLAQQYGEKLIAMGLASGAQRVLEIYVSETGSWTAVVTTPEAISCLVLWGDYWLPEPGPKGEA